MKTFGKQSAQGDILITRIDNLPDDVDKQKPSKDGHIVAHSETGHHHTLPARGVQVYRGDNSMIMFVVVKNSHADLKHHRSFDTHETLRLDKGTYEIRRQREYAPQGWRRIED